MLSDYHSSEKQHHFATFRVEFSQPDSLARCHMGICSFTKQDGMQKQNLQAHAAGPGKLAHPPPPPDGLPLMQGNSSPHSAVPHAATSVLCNKHLGRIQVQIARVQLRRRRRYPSHNKQKQSVSGSSK